MTRKINDDSNVIEAEYFPPGEPVPGDRDESGLGDDSFSSGGSQEYAEADSTDNVIGEALENLILSSAEQRERIIDEAKGHIKARIVRGIVKGIFGQ